MDVSKRELPYGLLYDVLKFKKEYYSDDEWCFSDELKNLFNGPKVNLHFDLKYKPRDYQIECVKKALELTKGIFRVGTGGGKSLIISYICDNLFKNNLCKRFLIIVPNLNLITQFKNDMIDYGFDADRIGEVWAGTKEWDKEIVISTWQSLNKYEDKLLLFDSFICDECHSVAGTVLRDMLSKMKNAVYRFGCTGTLSDDDLDDFNCRSYLGPVFKSYSAKYLKEQGYLADCQINQILLHYKKKFKGDYHEVKDEIFRNTFRLDIIRNKLLDVKSNLVLMLVNKVEDEGEFFLNYLKSFKEFDDYEIQFISR